MTTTTFPSSRSRLLYDVLKEKIDPLDAGLQSPESAAFLATRKGRFAHWAQRNKFFCHYLLFGVPAGVLGAIFAAFGGSELLTGSATLEEAIFTAATASTAVGVFGSMISVNNLEEKAKAALPRTSRAALFESLKEDLESINHSVIESSQQNLTFTTQRGMVVAGEDENGDLVMLFNGSPMQISYEGISPEPKRFITSITGQKIPVSPTATIL